MTIDTDDYLMVLMNNLIDIGRRYHHLEGDFCDITSCISLWSILRKNLRKCSTYISSAPRSSLLLTAGWSKSCTAQSSDLGSGIWDRHV